MQSNALVIATFYDAFSRLDHAAMNACYCDDIVFSDPVFGLLEGEEVRAMWEMLCRRAKDFSLTYSDIELLDDEYATCRWVARYTFTGTGNRVENKVKAFMKLKDGKIIEHSDAFRLSAWIGQALGWKGKCFGWMNWMKRKVQGRARRGLEEFMKRKAAG